MFVKSLRVVCALAMMAGGVVACSGHILIPQPQNPMYASSDADASVCLNGGQAVNFGYDNNYNGVLDPEEIEHSVVICNGGAGPQGQTGDVGATGTAGVSGSAGATGTAGVDGATGSVGPQGDTGATGSSGLSVAFSTSVLSPDPEVCPAGGTLVSSGLDLNSNGTLDEGEATASFPVCNGVSGTDGQDGTTAAPVLFTTQTATDAECPTGGTLINAGQDANLDSVLEVEEIQSNFAVCNGGNGQDGQDGSITFTNVVSCNANLNGKTAYFLGMTISTGETMATVGFDGSQLSVLSIDQSVIVDVVAGSGTYHFNVDVDTNSGTVSKNDSPSVNMTCVSYQ